MTSLTGSSAQEPTVSGGRAEPSDGSGIPPEMAQNKRGRACPDGLVRDVGADGDGVHPPGLRRWNDLGGDCKPSLV